MFHTVKRDLGGGALNLCAVAKVGVPVATPLRSQVHEVPDRSEQVNAALIDVGRHPGMRCVEVAHRAVSITGENGNRWSPDALRGLRCLSRT